MAGLQKREKTDGALSPVAQLKSLLGSTGYQVKFQEILGEKKSQFVSALTSLVSGSDQLQKCRPESIIKAAVDAAIMGLPIQSSLGYAYIVPYGAEAQFQIGYKGLVQLALNTGQFTRLGAGVVTTGQLTAIDEFQEPVFDWSKSGGDVCGFWAGFQLKTGFRKFVYLSCADAIAHAEKFSRAYQYDKKAGKAVSPWSTNFEAMGQKTAVKRLLCWAPKALDMIVTSTPAALDDDAIDTPCVSVTVEEPQHDQIEAAPEHQSTVQIEDEDILNFGK